MANRKEILFCSASLHCSTMCCSMNYFRSAKQINIHSTTLIYQLFMIGGQQRICSNLMPVSQPGSHLMHTSYIKCMVGIYLCYVYSIRRCLPKRAHIIVLQRKHFFTQSRISDGNAATRDSEWQWPYMNARNYTYQTIQELPRAEINVYVYVERVSNQQPTHVSCMYFVLPV